MRKNEPTVLKRSLPAATLMGLAWLSLGCASGPAEVRIQGIPVLACWIDRAETRSEDSGQAQACLSLSKKLWDRDVLESLRYLRRGAELRDADCCRQYLGHAESSAVNLSQRLYARLFVEGLLRKGPLVTRNGEDIRGELYTQLCCAWRYTEPVSLSKTRQVLEAMFESGVKASSPFLADMIRETGLRADGPSSGSARREEIQLYAGESAEDSRRWMRVPASPDFRETGTWIVSEAGAWGGGTDRLFLSANVLAFLVNAQGEPSFRGDRLWICNLGASPIYLTSLSVGQNNRELAPGREEILPLTQGAGKAESATCIPLTVRHRRMVR
jgi:hypothetical protein